MLDLAASALLLGLVQAHTNPDHLGRVAALVNFSGLGLVPVSYGLFGVLADATTLTGAFITGAGVQVVVVLCAYALPAVRTATFNP